MILTQLTDEEIEKIGKLISPQIIPVTLKTSLPRKMVQEVLLTSAWLLTKETGRVPMLLSSYLKQHSEKVAADLGLNHYDVQLIICAWIEVLVRAPPAYLFLSEKN